MLLRYVPENQACPHPALTQLRALRYFAAMPLEPLAARLALLEDSMTKRFEQQGKKSASSG
jgi:chorismate--pyruvate lyase